MKIYIILKSFRIDLLDDFTKQIAWLLTTFNIRFSGPIPLPLKIKRFTVNRSPHIYKKSREQFEIITRSRLMVLTGDIINNKCNMMKINKAKKEQMVDFIHLLENTAPAGVELKIKIITNI